MKRYATRYIPLLAGVLAVSAACEHKELCFDHDAHAPKSAVHIKAEYEKEWELMCEGGTDWKSAWQDEFGMEYDELRPDAPDGLRVQLYHEDGINNMLNVAPEGDVVQMRPGNHSVLLYNNDTKSIVFDNMGSYASAKATTRTRTRSSYLGNPYTENQARTLVMSQCVCGNYIKNYTAERKLETDELSVTMHPLVFRYLVRYEFKHGLECERWPGGAVAAAEEATILYDCTVEDFGVQACVHSFGIPDYPNGLYTTRAERRYGLNLEVRLKNGNTMSFDFDVTDQVAAQPQGGVIVVKDIEIPDDKGMEGGSGFDVDIDGWGEYEDIELPLQ